MIKRKYGYHEAMRCEHCEHCIEKAKKEDFEQRNSYLENFRSNLYLKGMSIEEAEEYIKSQYSEDEWYLLTKDIPPSIELFKRWNKAYLDNLKQMEEFMWWANEPLANLEAKENKQ